MTCCFLGTVSSVCYSLIFFLALHLPGHRFIPTLKLRQPQRETDSPVPRKDAGALPGVEFSLPPLLLPAKLELRACSTCHAFSSSLFKYYLLEAAGSRRGSARMEESLRGGETVLSCSTRKDGLTLNTKTFCFCYVGALYQRPLLRPSRPHHV